MKKPVPPILERFPTVKQRRLDQLLEKNGEGRITPKQKAELQRLVLEAEKLMVENARRLVIFSQHEETRVPAGAVPVTVWVQSEQAKR